MAVLSERAVSAPEARAVLEKKASSEGATYEQKIALEHLKKHVKLSAEDAKKMWVELESAGRLTPEQIAQVINVLPQKPEEVKALFSKDRSLTDEEIARIIEAVKKFV
ncbi:MAG: hypothetical protein HYS81_01295 [Candidatus Aenigmatarchaeota archaeon]|nr:MAG: hypothetical protein HYS81_01295 [Candidatus Aenigmarchaeota archaeon]